MFEESQCWNQNNKDQVSLEDPQVQVKDESEVKPQEILDLENIEVVENATKKLVDGHTNKGNDKEE